jgi:enediyne biosynthesis protein E4
MTGAFVKLVCKGSRGYPESPVIRPDPCPPLIVGATANGVDAGKCDCRADRASCLACLYFRWSLPSTGTFCVELISGLMLLITAGCQDSDSDVRPRVQNAGQVTTEAVFKTSARFADVTSDSGVHFVSQNGAEAGHFSILETLGAGVAMIDYDRDGWTDLVFPGGGTYTAHPSPTGLPAAGYRNNGDGGYRDVSTVIGISTDRLYTHAAIAGDFDNDGWNDILFTGYGGLLLFKNQGDGTFSDVGSAAGLISTEWNTGAAWGDLNGDSFPDLYVVRYVDWSFRKNPRCDFGAGRDVCPPGQFDALNDILFMGNGDSTFRDASSDAGLVDGGKGLAAFTADLDVDGDLDIYVANDSTPNFLYRNDGNGIFEEVGIVSGTALNERAESDGSMGIDVGDFDRDGLPDIWVANYENQSYGLYRNNGDCLFQHVSSSRGITAVDALFVGFGTSFLDFDLDGDEDLIATNGHVMRTASSSQQQYPLLLENVEGERFVHVTEQAGDYFRQTHHGRGLAVGDIDNDGDEDVVITHIGAPAAVLENQSKTTGHWLVIELSGKLSARDAVGAAVTVTAGGRGVYQQQTSGTSFNSTADQRLYFGVGEVTEVSLDILWPSGARQSWQDIHADSVLLITEGREWQFISANEQSD